MGLLQWQGLLLYLVAWRYTAFKTEKFIGIPGGQYIFGVGRASFLVSLREWTTSFDSVLLYIDRSSPNVT